MRNILKYLILALCVLSVPAFADENARQFEGEFQVECLKKNRQCSWFFEWTGEKRESIMEGPRGGYVYKAKFVVMDKLGKELCSVEGTVISGNLAIGFGLAGRIGPKETSVSFRENKRGGLFAFLTYDTDVDFCRGEHGMGDLERFYMDD
jgi:hypothetical protein